ncbi:hypothetical protein PseudUWO311_00640 [Pseudanabaena sp. UWO311]|uniref:hypothetical protein n=1 Tax=Pseudanabaena sp. UWO311 TaxID=2487337 RepID=UPI001157920C|nr:hypothetical protein [Pseudanabaena sp. UWO311]TYQ29438.1 hypothetical protein PseudUWO311_00640 [Pseudanabaena sp. UWO311]
MQPNNLTATIWLSPYRLTYRTSDHELTGAINRPDPDLLQKTLERLYAYLINEGYSPLILHMEH